MYRSQLQQVVVGTSCYISLAETMAGTGVQAAAALMDKLCSAAEQLPHGLQES
jgi:hypothetical protein